MWRLRVGLVDDRLSARLASQDVSRDDEPSELPRALVDLGDLRVAVVPLDRELAGVAVPAEDLDRLGGLPAGHLGGIELRLRPLGRVRLSGLLEPRGAIREQARGVDLRSIVR